MCGIFDLLNLSGKRQNKEWLAPISSLPIAENGEVTFGQAAKRQACTSWLFV
jgi:hypothetical protein